MNALTQLPPWLEMALTVLVLLGAFFALVGSWGLAKMGSFLTRLHGPTKASTLGVGCMLLASIGYFSFAHASLSLHELLITLFVFLTAPVSAHLLVQAAMHRDPALRPPPSPPAAPSEQPETPN